MPYYKVTWQVYVRAKDESEALEAADREREPRLRKREEVQTNG